jgi:hypothetical protein
MNSPSPAVPPLRERFSGYLVAFCLGLAAGGVLGVVIWLATSARLIDTVGYTYSALGALLLLVGGVRGSGYLSPAAGAPGSPTERGDGPAREGAADPWRMVGRRGGLDAVERRRRRLLAPANPAAFWQVVAGCAYLAVGVVLTVLCAAPVE